MHAVKRLLGPLIQHFATIEAALNCLSNFAAAAIAAMCQEPICFTLMPES